MLRWLLREFKAGIELILIYLYKLYQNDHWKRKRSTPVNNDNLLALGRVSNEYYPQQKEDIFIDTSFRMKHMYLLGATGTGKTNLLKSFLRQDIQSSKGFCLIDCHGDLVKSVTSYIASLAEDEKEALHLADNTVIIEPFNKKWVIGFNPLNMRNKESLYPKAIEIISIFQKVWGKDTFGPRTSELFRNTILTLMDNDLTLLEASELLSNDYFRNNLIDKISIPEVKSYWLYRYNPLSDKMKAMYREAVINKLTVFTSDPQVRLMLGSNQNSFDFEQAMNEGKWIILNLAKGHLKENMNLLATLFISHLTSSAFNRINIPYHQRRQFYLYIDEFQNFCHSNDLITLLSEARKVAIGTILAHQHSKQIDSDILKAILGNTQTQIYFRLSYQDSLFFASELDPKQKDGIAKALIDLPVGKSYLKIKGTLPYLLSTSLCPEVYISKEVVNEFKELIFSTHGRPKNEVITEIENRQRIYQSHEAGIIAPELIKNELEEGQDDW